MKKRKSSKNSDICLDPIYKGILYYIYEEKRVSPDEIASLYGFTRQAADYRLRKLVSNNLVKKEYVKGKVYYSLTDKALGIIYEKNSKFLLTKDTVSIIRKIALLPIAIGVIGLGRYIALGETYRGMITLFLWLIIAVILQLIISAIENKYIRGK